MKKIFKYIFHRDHFVITLSAFAQLLILMLITFNISFLNPIAKALENFSITDMFFDIQHSGSNPETCDLVTLVDMTELYSRGDIANMFEKINQNNPLCVGIDLIFEGEKDDRIGNEILEDAVKNLKCKSVFSIKLTNFDDSLNSFTKSIKSYFSNRIKINEAYTNLNDDMNESCIRNFSISQTICEEKMLSFPAKIASIFDESIAELQNDEVLINFKNVNFPIVSYYEINEKRDLIDGHIVLVGTMTEEQDMHNTPLGKMSGLELQAYSLLTLLEHKSIHEAPQWFLWILAFLICYILELTIDIFIQAINKHSKSMLMVFLKESNLVSIVILFIWAVVICWLMFVMFVKNDTSISGGIILGLMALVCEGRDLLKAVVKAIGAKHGNNSFVKTSLMKDNDLTNES